MRKTVVDQQHGLIGARRKVMQTSKYGLCLALTADEASALLGLVEERLQDLKRRRLDFQKMASEIGGKVAWGLPFSDAELEHWTAFLDMLRRTISGEKHVQYTGHQALIFTGMMAHIESQTEFLFQALREEM